MKNLLAGLCATASFALGTAALADHSLQQDRFVLADVQRVTATARGGITVVARGYTFIDGKYSRPVSFVRLQRLSLVARPGVDAQACHAAALEALASGNRFEVVVAENQFGFDLKAAETALTLEIQADDMRACALQKK